MVAFAVFGIADFPGNHSLCINDYSESVSVVEIREDLENQGKHWKNPSHPRENTGVSAGAD